MMSKQQRIKQVKEVIKNCNNIRQVCIAIGILPYGGSYQFIKNIIKQQNLDTSHFHTHNTAGISHASLPLEDILIKGSYYINTSSLKKKIIQEGLLEQKCACCLRSTYEIRDKIIKMPLQLHHKDGDRQNNELSNLVLLCPICHSLTSTHRGKKKKIQKDYMNCKTCGKEIRVNKFGYCKDCYIKYLEKIKYEHNGNDRRCITGHCIKCGQNLYTYSKHKMCLKCYRQSIKNPNKPSKEQLQQQIKQNSFLALGRKYDVSDNTIRNWCKQYEIDYKQYGKIRIQSLLALQKSRQELAKTRQKVVSFCPLCGKPKHKESKTCRECYYKNQLKHGKFSYNNLNQIGIKQ